jgi:hypothetical protein
MIKYYQVALGLMIILASCKYPKNKIVQPTTDTTKVIELAIRTGFYGYLPDYTPLKHKYHFGDSILFTSIINYCLII